MADPWEGWYCFRCSEPVREGDIQLAYLDFKRQLKGPKCPSCGAPFVSEEMGRKLRNVEEQIEEK